MRLDVRIGDVIRLDFGPESPATGVEKTVSDVIRSCFDPADVLEVCFTGRNGDDIPVRLECCSVVRRVRRI